MDDEGGLFNMFGDDEDEEEKTTGQEAETKKEEPPAAPVKIKHDGCPLEGDPKDAKVRIMYEGELFPAKIKSYQPESDTYTIVWTSSGVLQYRTKPSDINWDPFVEVIEEKKETKAEEDELWLAARRGSLASVKKFIESGVHFNETGKAQQRTPFYHAVFCGHLAVTEYLISLGANDSDNTAFITANEELRELLLRTGAGGKRRASIRKSITVKNAAGEEKTEAKEQPRKASVAKAAEQAAVGPEATLSTEEQNAPKQPEEQTSTTAETAAKTETRKQSVALKKAASTKTVTIDAVAKDENGNVQKPEEKAPEKTEEKAPEKAEACVKTPMQIVPAKNARKGNPFFRILTAFLPRRIFSRKRQ